MYSRPILSYCRSKVLQNAQVEHSPMLLSCTKLPLVSDLYFGDFVVAV